MRAHDAVDTIVVMPERIQQTRREPTLPIALMYDELSYPTYSFGVVIPAAGERVTSKGVIDGHSDVGALGVFG